MVQILCLLLLVSAAELSQAGKHLLRFVTFCRSNISGDGQYDIEFDGDQLLYADPFTYQPIQRLPEFAGEWTPDPGLSQDAYVSLGTCYYNMPRAIKGENSPPESITTPTALIYPKDEIEMGLLNTLICFVNNLHPPLVNITWTRNGELVDQRDVSQTEYYSNRDFSFYMASYLEVIPEEGDVYACSVQHVGLQVPLTRFLEVMDTDRQLSETVLCVCGVILGLTGLVTGLWFIFRQH